MRPSGPSFATLILSVFTLKVLPVQSPSVVGATTVWFSRWGNLSTETGSSLSKVTQLGNVRAGIWTQVCLTPKPLTRTLNCLYWLTLQSPTWPSPICFRLQSPHAFPSDGKGKMGLFFQESWRQPTRAPSFPSRHLSVLPHRPLLLFLLLIPHFTSLSSSCSFLFHE